MEVELATCFTLYTVFYCNIKEVLKKAIHKTTNKEMVMTLNLADFLDDVLKIFIIHAQW